MIAALVLSWSVASVSAQSSPSDAQVRSEAKKILAEPEFRYFEHLDDADDRPEHGFSSGGGRDDGDDEAGLPGESRGGKAGKSSKGRHRPGSKKTDNSNASSQNSGDSSNGLSSFGELGGAISGVLGLVFHAIAYLVLIVVCGLIVYLIFRAVVSYDSPSRSPLTGLLNLTDPQADDHSPGELPADAYLELARQLAQQHRYREAVAHLLLGGMSNIERSELIRHRRGLTLRDYLRALRGQPSQYAGFQTMISLYEPVGFGRRVASFQTFQDALAGYQQVVA